MKKQALRLLHQANLGSSPMMLPLDLANQGRWGRILLRPIFMRTPDHIFIQEVEHVLICAGCLVDESIPQRLRNNPESRMEFIELWMLDHSDCAKFRSAQKARANRELRKEADRRRLLKINP